MSATDAKPSRKQKQKEVRVHPAPNGAERLKTVVRRLPPNLPEEVFWQSVHAWVTDDTVAWKSYCPGKWRTKRPNKEGIPSRAYIAFRNEEQVATFSREYDGHLFRDKAGNESQAVVEFAPFQKVPAEKKKVDARNNTIDRDEDYLSFLESLKSGPKTESVTLETLIAASQPPPPPTTTPLLEALKAEKSAQKDREAILRNHAHYKDAGASVSLSKKEEAKKKAVAAAQQATKLQSEQATSALSRKGKKAAAAMQKISTVQAQAQGQDGQAPPGSIGKSQPVAPPLTPGGHTPRHRPPRDRVHVDKGDAVPPPSGSGSGSGSIPTLGNAGPPLSPPVSAENAPAPGSSRKGRPTIGLGRQFEAALSGTGVGVTPTPGGERRKRDKDKDKGTEAGSAAAEHGGRGGGGGGRPKEEGAHVPATTLVPNILQRPEGVGGQSDVLMVQRPLSPTGPPRRRARGRGRGGHRGG